MKNNRKCICCGTEYEYCPRCGKDSLKPAWYAIYHEENCKNIFDIASDYFGGEITKEEAREKFSQCDLSKKESFHHSVIRALNEVYDISEKMIDTVEDISDLTKNEVINSVIESVAEDISDVNNTVEEKVVETKMSNSYSNKSNKKYRKR